MIVANSLVDGFLVSNAIGKIIVSAQILGSILMVATISLMILIICNLLLSLIAGFTGRGGETICRLLYSLVLLAVHGAALPKLFSIREAANGERLTAAPWGKAPRGGGPDNSS